MRVSRERYIWFFFNVYAVVVVKKNKNLLSGGDIRQ